MDADRLMPIHDAAMLAQGERVLGEEFTAMNRRVLEVTGLTSRLNVLPFDDEAGRARLLEQILGRPLAPRVTILPPFFTDHGLRLELAERVFINQNCTFLDYAGIRLGEGVMVGPKAAFITVGHPVDPDERRHFLSGAPIDVAENVWIGAGATILPGVSIGRDSVIAAGTVVADDVPAASLVAGPKGTVRRRW
ncbi:Acetyltransferase (isoleucine patch superfamily) [Agromyces sp. CF514]|uniref:sugar O-acetyltransferase n=1 Tax=Agromyces sp. CF514 TaxID=1881031 RepID=UPI0008E63AF3|nr:sugar O-acetyltransferase [Agromyces sp. CF514]SFR84060.1 Acetyltransferase (isoleucine patch superfamily) [Agromyces sp. CF514]